MPDTRLEFAQKAALLTGELLLNKYLDGDHQATLKKDRTLVTAADREADQLLHDLISDKYPGEGILSEERSTLFPQSPHAWVIDPLDGTVNFSQGLSYWGVSIAHLENGVPRTAALYFPTTNELFTAAAGKGAWLNGQLMQVAEESAKTLFPIFVHCSRMHQRYHVNLPYKKRSLGAAAYHICLIANNTAALAFESTPRIWDFAASWLVVIEAGGFIHSFGKEQPFPAHPGEDYHKRPFPIVAASSQDILTTARDGITHRQ
jgi:myo-inositol-1(or 4)-monophosphatase